MSKSTVTIRFITAALLALIAAFSRLAVGAHADEVKTLPGTRPLLTSDDLSMENLKAVDRYLLKLVEQSVQARQAFWERDYANQAAYEKSVRKNRESLRRRLGAVDPRKPPADLELVSSLKSPALVAESDRVSVFAVRWSVFDDVDAQGLLLQPKSTPRALVVAVPDADWTPEMLAGLRPDAPRSAALAWRLAQAGCRVLVPTIIDRQTTWSGSPRVRKLNQTHREFIYRQAFFMGRHLIGYEVQKVLAAVDYLRSSATEAKNKLWLGVAGYGEGGLIAFYSAALDTRIDATLVSGYFQPRERVYQEPSTATSMDCYGSSAMQRSPA